MLDLHNFIQECERACVKESATETIHELVQSAISDPQALRAALPEITGEEQQVYYSQRLTITNLRLAHNVHYPPHNQNMPVVVGVYNGSAHYRFYRQEQNQLILTERRDLAQGSVAMLNANTIYSMANNQPEPTWLLKVYLGDLVQQERNIWKPHTFEAYPYTTESYFSFAEAFDPNLPFQ